MEMDPTPKVIAHLRSQQLLPEKVIDESKDIDRGKTTTIVHSGMDICEEDAEFRRKKVWFAMRVIFLQMLRGSATPEFKRFFVEFVLVDALMALRCVTKTWKGVVEDVIGEGVGSGAMGRI
ncbi:hypothetical protein TrLO_g240 [Triparma laevis f. longispina]|uniref:Uncharacterized protein n=1 Tax=Triparma laevis f. longispina TaxID=1714387 RepID=A0A9W7A3E6_9STRA|nr:hypothetical protein TrLO_g240 [Triparma laevis f. longispina]